MSNPFNPYQTKKQQTRLEKKMKKRTNKFNSIMSDMAGDLFEYDKLNTAVKAAYKVMEKRELTVNEQIVLRNAEIKLESIRTKHGILEGETAKEYLDRTNQVKGEKKTW